MRQLLFAIAQEHAEEGGDAARLVLPEIDELIFGAIIFAIFLAILWWKAIPKFREALKNRENAIRSEMERAEQSRLEAEEAREEYRKRLADARAQADRVIREASATAEEVRRDIIAKAEEDARGIRERALADLGQERDRMMADVRRELADIALAAASRVVERELADPQAQRQLVDQFISSVSARSNGGG